MPTAITINTHAATCHLEATGTDTKLAEAIVTSVSQAGAQLAAQTLSTNHSAKRSKPFSELWNVTRSTAAARTSRSAAAARPAPVFTASVAPARRAGLSRACSGVLRPPGVPGSSSAGSSGGAAVRYKYSTAATAISKAAARFNGQASLQAHQRGLQVGLNGDLLVGLADGLDDRLGLRGGDASRGQPLDCGVGVMGRGHGGMLPAGAGALGRGAVAGR